MAGGGTPVGPRLNVLVTGGSGPSGIAVAGALRRAGHRVFTAGSDRTRIDAAAEQAGDGVTPLVCDLADLDAVRALRATVAAAAGPMDGVIHLVGGWRGAQGIADQSDDDWDFLERGAITTLAASGTGRFAMVSSTAVDTPTAATASYVAAKAAAETWTLAVADGFRRTAPGSAAVVLVVKALVDAELRRQHPERTFPGATDVEDLAAAVVRLFSQPAAGLNGQRLLLAP
jgi:NAD(P)-dependent dehydrogenase (short-subunit alcohol dehydrogenase family)